MQYQCQIIADSEAPHGGRLTTFEIQYPWIVHWDHTRHREQSLSVASNRAIPFLRVVEMLKAHPFVPEWRYNARGMSPAELLNEHDSETANVIAQQMLADVLRGVEELGGQLDVHKQWLNKYLIPWNWVTVIVTATQFDNFFALRCHPAAQDEIQKIAVLMACAYYSSKPTPLTMQDWHTPYASPAEFGDDLHQRLKSSVARCARGSYYRQWEQSTHENEAALHDRLLNHRPMHASPFEHQGTPTVHRAERSGNFVGWLQYRKTKPADAVYHFDFEKWRDDYGTERPEILGRICERDGIWTFDG